jgi:DNA repair photolyase
MPELPHGRGAGRNPANRFIPLYYEDDPARVDPDGPAPRTEFYHDKTRSIVATNDSPDVGFTHSINPYRGCEHGCTYCLAGETMILMGNGSTRRLDALRVGDEIYGTVRVGWYRRYVRTRVLDRWRTIKPAYRISLADGTKLVASGDHRFLTQRGWKHVSGKMGGELQRPFLTVNNKLMGIGAFATAPDDTDDYRRGYLSGLIRGDGVIGRYDYTSPRRVSVQHQFRLALVDQEALCRASDYLARLGIKTQEFVFARGNSRRAPMNGIRTHARASVEFITAHIGWPTELTDCWAKGFLAGIFDAEGSFSDGIWRVSNTCPEIIAHVERSLKRFAFAFAIEKQVANRERPIVILRIRGGLKEHLRFFLTVGTAISRKRSLVGQAVKSSADLRVTAVEPLGVLRPFFDITTGTGDFIANGVVSHNCYARPFHEYLGLSAGLDFETKIMVKADAPQLLRKELMAKSWKPVAISLSGVTDCYQPIERRLKVTRGCLEVLAEFRNPCGIVTKNHLVTRDIDVLKPLAELNATAVFLSVTTLDADLVRKMEPRASSPEGRLTAIRQLSAAGIPVGVMVAPVVPGLTDHEIPAILAAVKEAGARCAGYVLLRLPFAIKDLFAEWLEHHFPERKAKVLSRLRELRDGGLYDSRFGHRMRGDGPIADMIHDMFLLHRARLGLDEHGPELSIAHFKRPGLQQQTMFE